MTTRDPAEPPDPSPATTDGPTPDVPEGAAPTQQRSRAALGVTALLIASSALGLLRDLSLAGLFGASGDTDAFLVAWTIPETVSVLLMEGAMSYLLVPVFVRELSRRGSVSRVVQATLLPLLVVLTMSTTAVVMLAPLLVDVLAPGIAERSLAIDCFRIAAATVLFMGVAGFLMAVLRAHERFLRPASAYVAYNVGILATMFALHGRLGVVSAALGLAIGSALMVAVQVPAFLRVVSLRGLRVRFERRMLAAMTAFFPVALYSMGRQMQVFVERIVGSNLESGAISYMNYASKVSQMASLLALTAAAVAFPSLARIASDRSAFRDLIEREARRLVLLIVPSIAFLTLFAEPVIRALFERGAFDQGDTAQTTVVMRVYVLGLLGQVLVSLGTYVCFAARSRSWLPGVAAVAGLLVTIVLDVSLAPLLGVTALAVGNAVGITVTAVMIWTGIRRGVVDYPAARLARLFVAVAPLAALCATLAWFACRVLPPIAFLEVAVGGTLTVVLYLVATAVGGVRESRDLVRSLSGLTGRLARRSGRGAA